MNWDVIREEETAVLQALLRFDTTNPPGNETLCIDHIANALKREGIEPLVFEPAPGRGNLVARLKGDGSLPPLFLMGHIDAVPAKEDKWRRQPFSGDWEGGIVWRRGATDMKRMVTMELMTMLLLKRQAVPLQRDVILMANADEETGGVMGAGWVAKNHPELVRAEYAINEGGGTCIELGGRSFFSARRLKKGRYALRCGGAGSRVMRRSRTRTMRSCRSRGRSCA